VLQADPELAKGSSFTRECWASPSSQHCEGGTRDPWEVEGETSERPVYLFHWQVGAQETDLHTVLD
jgi:hypothetical protein